MDRSLFGCKCRCVGYSNELGIREFGQSDSSIPLHVGNMRQTSQTLSTYRRVQVQRLQSAPAAINENETEMPQHLLFMDQPNPYQNNQLQSENDYFTNLTPPALVRRGGAMNELPLPTLQRSASVNPNTTQPS